MPEPAEHPGQVELPSRVGRGEPVERGTQVVVVGLELIRQLPFARDAFGVCVGSSSLEELGMSVADRVRLAGRVEPFERVLADRLKHHEPVALASHQALVHQRAERVQVGVAYRLRGFKANLPANTPSRAKSEPSSGSNRS